MWTSLSDCVLRAYSRLFSVVVAVEKDVERGIIFSTISTRFYFFSNILLMSLICACMSLSFVDASVILSRAYIIVV